ncbi:MAG: S8 family peptidase [Jatrophihabitans sp.]|uniref:S8 family peptidase n=1 Tax=Jatrophihabitans sp. TaxID=1932789 RepID=UPI003F7E14D3
MPLPRPTVASIIAAAVTAGAAVATPAAAEAAPTTPMTAPTGGAVIVLLRDQHSDLPLAGPHSARPAAVAADQASVAREATALGATKVHGFRLINAFSASLTSSQISSLSKDPKVAAIVPDLPIPAPRTATTTNRTATPSSKVSVGACTSDPRKPLLEPEALQLTNDASNDRRAPAATKIVTGAGVKVAFMADGIDPNNPDFIRANGRHVFVDYQDFTGEGRNAPSGAAEAFGDASSIAAQGRKVYDLHNYGNNPTLPSGCTIRVRGMAPGASLVGLKVFGNAPTAPTSHFIDAIDYAVRVQRVDVLNESFGGNPYPDNGNDPITLADRMAVAAGVTVVASTGDAGVTGTVGSPATDPSVIGVAATTSYRIYSQLGYGGANFSKGRWISDNISGISSGGVAQNGRVPDLAAPGDDGWALCSTNTAVYAECLDNAGNPSNLLQFGGTSQSSPLTAGAAALVIQAYRQTHRGATPSPALVKQLLTSTATDLGHPAQEQGAGLLNALAAVNAARSIPTRQGHPARVQGANLVLSRNQLALVDNPNTRRSTTVQVRNLSGRTEIVTPTLRSLTRERVTVSGKLPINTDTSKYFVDSFGIQRAYVAKPFMVGRGHDRLVVRAAAPAAPDGVLRTILIDPRGRLAYYTVPQGASNYALAEVRQPIAGRWTAYFAMGRSAAFHGYVTYSVATQEFVTTRAVSPSSARIAPGAVAAFRITTRTPAGPGDVVDSVQFATNHGRIASMPLVLRSVVPGRPTTFTGTITGGNGRQLLPAQANSYYLTVPAHEPALNVDLRFGDDKTLVVGVLVGPNGQVASYKTNGNAFDSRGFNLFARAPQAGRWVLTLAVANPVSGTLLSYPFSAKIGYSAVSVQASLPKSVATTLASGHAVRIPVRITNTTRNSLDLFADPRLTRTGNIPLPQLGDGSTSFGLPASSDVAPQWLVPTEVDRADFTIRASTPVNWDVFFTSGEPELYAGSVGDGHGGYVVDARAQARSVSAGFWSGDVGEPGPFATTAKSGTATVSAVAHGQLFDRAVTTSTKDFWRDGPTVVDSKTGAYKSGVAPLNLLPGETGRVVVTVIPNGAVGSKVRGTVYLGSYDGTFGGSGDELAALPYAYTVGAAS